MKFNIPFTTGNERRYIDEVFESQHFSGNGPFTNRVQSWLEDYLGAERVLLTHSCTAALEMSAMLYDLRDGDEFIVPSFTFVTSASSMMRGGATPVFCEIDPVTMLMDIDDARSRITENTKVIVPVHYAGSAPNMEHLLALSEESGVRIVEDAAQGLGSKWNGQRLGAIAPLGAISFHETKNIHCGLGGCLIINDKELVERAEIIWERGTDRSAFFKGLVDKYSWKEVGSSFYPSELQAAFLLAQLEAMESNLKTRRGLWKKYHIFVSDFCEEFNISIISPPENTEFNAHMFAIILNSPEEADYVRRSLTNKGIGVVIHYVPLHSSEMGRSLGYHPDDLPITMRTSGSLLRLPMHHQLSVDDIQVVVGALRESLDEFKRK